MNDAEQTTRLDPRVRCLIADMAASLSEYAPDTDLLDAACKVVEASRQ